MRKVIHKQFIKLNDLDDVVTLEVPTGAEILSIGNQHETMAFWYLFNEDEEFKEKRRFRIAGTGHVLNKTPDVMFTHIDTVQFNEGRLVLHVFEICELPF